MPDVVDKADLDALEQGIDQALGKIQSLLELEVYAENLPIIGSQLSQAQAALQTIITLRNTIREAIDTISNLPDLASQTAAAIRDELQGEINEALAALGSGFAGTVNVSINETTGDIAMVFDTGRTTSMTFAPGDLGMSGLGLDMSGNGTAQLAYNFDFKVGLDSTGFYLDTGASNLSLGVDVSLNGLSAATSLGFLNFSASNIPDSDPAAGADTLTLDLVTSWNQSGLVRDFTADLLNVTASGDLDLDIHLAADMGDAALPSISTDLHVDWGFTQNLLNGTSPNSWNAATITFDNVEYGFGTFVEQFITPLLEQLDPILGPVNDALAVLRTDISGILLPEWAAALDVVTDGKVTALDFLQLASNAKGLGIDFGPLAQIIDLVDTIVDVVEFFRGRDFADGGYDIGNYQFELQQIQGAVDTLSQLDIGSGTFTGANINVGTFLDGLAGLAGYNATFSNADSDHNGETGRDLIGGLLENSMLSFGPVENPISVIQLLLGQDIDLFRLDLPTINIGIGMDAAGNVTTPVTAASLPIWPLPLVTANLNVAMQAVIDLAFGYDTTGLNQYAAGDFSNPALVLNGFYLDDQRSGGVDIPEIVIRAAVELALDANFAVVSVGGGGNLIGTVALDFADALFGEDARLYLNELPGDFLSNPFQIFDISGRVTAGLRFYVNSVVGNLVNWNSQRVTLADFSFVQGAETAGPPAGLGDQFGGALWINMGPRAGERDILDASDVGETFEIGAGPGGKVVVQAFGYTQVFGETTPVTSIEVDAGNFNDEVTLDSSLTIAARITGGAGYDSLTGGGGDDDIYGGTEGDWLRGNGGADDLYGEDGNDYLEGGAGADRIDGGAGSYDIATYAGSGTGITLNLTTGVHSGDAAGDTFVGIEIFEGSRHADVMTGGAGNDVFASLEGDDTLDTKGGDDILAAGTGANILDGGDGYDIANYYFAGSAVTVSMTGLGGTVVAGPEGARTIDDTLANIEQVNGSDFADTMTGGTGRQVFVGGAGNDWLDGGDDSDILVGGTGADTLGGGEGSDYASYFDAAAGVTASLASGGAGGEALGDTYSGIENLIGSGHADSLTGDGIANYIFGGGGDDTIAGGGGNDVLEGGAGADSFNGGDGNDEVTYASGLSGLTVNLRDPGANTGDAIGDSFTSIEIISGTNYADTIRGSDSTSASETLAGGGGNDTLYGGLGNDTLLGGAGGDTLWGEDGADTLQGGDGADTLRGGVGLDVLQGGTGNDTLDGGDERDRVTYFDSTGAARVNLSTAASSNGIVTVAALTALDGFGGTDAFVTAGDGRSSVEDATGSLFNDFMTASENGSRLEGLAGNDLLKGVSGDDVLVGGLGDDNLQGGLGNDLLDGGAGIDRIDGGSGSDTANYENDVAGVVASLAAGSATDGSGSTDTFFFIENLRGSSSGDQLTGNTSANRLEGLAGNDVIDGGAGGDTMVGGTGDDIFYVDSVTAPSGNDTVIEASGEGSDLIRTSVDYGNQVTVVALAANVEDLQLLGSVVYGYGNSSSNRLIGNVAANVIDGLEGADTFWGYAGDDTYWFDDWGDSIGIGAAPRGSSGADGEVAGGGIDTIMLRTGNLTTEAHDANFRIDNAWGGQIENVSLADDDRAINLVGNALDNRLSDNAKSQTLSGGAGNDVLVVSGGNDTVYGGTGTDVLTLAYGAITADLYVSYGYYTSGDSIYGAYHAADNLSDVLFYEIERFDITSGAGNDTLHGWVNNDVINAGAGNDLVDVGPGNDLADGGIGTDRISADVRGAVSGIIWNLQTNTYSNTENYGSFTNFEYFGTVHATNFDDTIVTTSIDKGEIVHGHAGNDSFRTVNGADAFYAGDGSDRLIVDWSQATGTSWVSYGLYNHGDGSFYGAYHNGDGRDVLFYNLEHVTFIGSAQTDEIVAWGGDDIFTMGAGNDWANVGAGVNVVDGGSGIDRLSIDYGASEVAIVLDLTLAGAQLTSGPGAVSGFEWVNGITTSAFDDTVVTLELFRDDFISTGDGDDVVTVLNGADTVHFGNGDDRLIIDWSTATGGSWVTYGLYGHGNGDFYGTYYNADGRSVHFQHLEHVTFTGSAQNDEIVTWGGDDVFTMGAGDDWANVGAGVNVVDGGSGTDRLSIDYGASEVAIVLDLTLAGAQLSSGPGAISGIEWVNGITTSAMGDTVITLDLALNDWIDTGDGNDVVTVRNGADEARLGGGNDRLIVDWSTASGTSSVTYGLYGHGGGDFYGTYTNSDGRSVYFQNLEHVTFIGSAQNDEIVAWGGDDVFTMGAGNDWANVGAGTNVIDGGSGTDRLSIDYGASTVAIVLDLTLSGAQLTSGPGSVSGIEWVNGITTSAFGDTVVTLDFALNDWIDTGDGNDVVTVRNGADEVRFGGGSDRLVVDWSSATGTSSVTYGLYGHGGGDFYGTYTNSDGRSVYFQNLEHVTFTGSAQNDEIVAWGGDDVFNLGAGDDAAHVGGGINSVDGGEGIDRLAIDYSASATGIVLDLTLTGEQLTSGPGSIRGIEWVNGLTGTALSDVIVTTAFQRSDSIDTGEGDDKVTLYAGTDRVTLGGGVDTLVIDWSTSSGNVYLSYGLYNSGGDTFYGTYSNSDGSSAEFWGAERFEMYLGSGDDVVSGLSGRDILSGGAGNDTLTGNGGNDVLDGGTGSDVMNGGAGDDVYHVDEEGDVVNEAAGEGIDEVRTTLGAYTLGANLENLTGLSSAGQNLTGNSAVNVITGGAGNDIIDGGGGADTMSGGAGDDIYYVDNAADLVIEEAGGGYDEVRTSLASYTAVNVEKVTAISAGGQTLVGDDGDNILIGFTGADTLQGNGGNDVLEGGAGADTLDGGTGSDTASYAGSAAGVTVDLATSIISGGDAAGDTLVSIENLIGSDHADTLIGNALANQIDGGAGADTLAGGLGNDVYVVDNAGDVVSENAGAGTDEVRTSLASYTLGANLENLTGLVATGQALTGNALANLIVGLAGNDTLSGGAGNDALVGGAGNDVLDGGIGSDTMTGGTGNDVYYVDSADVVTELAGEGTDEVRTTRAGYVLGDNVENLTGLLATGQNLIGNALANAITGGAGNDKLDGQGGADALAGGLGNDTYYIDNAGDTVFEAGGAGTDEVRTTLASYQLTVNVENLVGTGTGGQTLVGNGLANTITGSGAGDVLNGSGGNDTMIGLNGNDIYYVGQAGDVVVEQASHGNDLVRTTIDFTLPDNVERLRIISTSGVEATGNGLDNHMVGNTGADVMWGMGGVDRLDGVDGNDEMHGGDGGDYLWGGAGADELFGDEGNDFLRGQDGDDTLHGGAGIDSLTGGTGNDTLHGGSETDNLQGQAGSDVLWGGAGTDYLTGGTEADTFAFADGDTSADASLADRILDFSQAQGDRLDLSAMDANTLIGGDQAFAFIGTNAFAGTGAASAGELRYTFVGAYTFVQGDTDGNGTADFMIRLDGNIAFTGVDVIL